MLDEAQLQHVRDAFANADAFYVVRARLQEFNDEGLTAPVIASGFHFLSEAHVEARERRGGPWGPMVEMDGWQFPPPLEEIDDEILDVWVQLVQEIDHPASKARCGDLLWVRKHPPAPHESARAAVAGYLALADDQTWNDLERTEGLGRALELTRELNAVDLLMTVSQQMLDAAFAEMTTDEWRPGITLRLLQPLVALPVARRPADLQAAFEAAGARYGADPHIAQAVSESLQSLVTHEERQAMQRDVIKRWIEESEKGDALLRVIRLQQALELAMQAGLRAEIEDLRLRLQSISTEDLGLVRFEAEVSMPTEYIEGLIAAVKDMALTDALRYLGLQGPPTGSPSEVEAAAARSVEKAPLAGLLPRVVVGATHATPALNLRNEIAHATRTTFNQLDAALLLHVCCWLAGVTVTQRTDAS